MGGASKQLNTAATKPDWPMVALMLLPTMAWRRAAQRQLGHALPADAAAQLMAQARQNYPALSATRPRHGFALNRLMAIMQGHAALYPRLRAHGLSTTEAGEIIEAINWQIFGPSTRLAFALSRLRSGRRLRRVRWIIDLLFRLVFTAPFRRQMQAGGEGLWFDVQACPLADYFRARNLPELAHHAACQLDYRMAQVWGVQLQRQKTIAREAPLCDFRFHPLNTQEHP